MTSVKVKIRIRDYLLAIQQERFKIIQDAFSLIDFSTMALFKHSDLFLTSVIF